MDLICMSIVEKFRSSVFISDDDILQVTTEDEEIDQETITSLTFNDPHSNKFPSPSKYRKAFLKRLITIIEGRGEGVDEDLYHLFLSHLSRLEEEKYAYKSFPVKGPRSDWLVVKESLNSISNGTTGLSAWQAAYYMSEWVSCNKEFFENRCIIELGSGTGMVGLVLLKLCNPMSFIFSDHHPHVLDVLNHNITINGWTPCRHENKELHGSDDDGEKSFDIPKCPRVSNPDTLSNPLDPVKTMSLERSCSTQPCILKLDWETVSDEFLDEVGRNVETIIASDVVFDTRLIPSLVRVIERLLRTSIPSLPLTPSSSSPPPSSSSPPPSSSSSSPPPSSPKKAAYICGVIRNKSTWECFIRMCDDTCLHVERLEFVPPSEGKRMFKYFTHSTESEIVKLTLK